MKIHSIRSSRTARLLLAVDIIDGILDGADLFGRIVGDFDAKFLFKRHDEFDNVEAVCAQIVNEACAFGDLICLDAEMFEALVTAGNSLIDDRSVRVVVLHGEGPSFCAGLDFSSFTAMAGGGGNGGGGGESNGNGDGNPDYWEQYKDGALVAILYDDDYDNKVDRKDEVPGSRPKFVAPEPERGDASGALDAPAAGSGSAAPAAGSGGKPK